MSDALACPNCGWPSFELNDDDGSRTCAECHWTLLPSPIARAGIEAARAALAKAVAEHPANESEPEVNLRLVVDPATEETP